MAECRGPACVAPCEQRPPPRPSADGHAFRLDWGTGAPVADPSSVPVWGTALRSVGGLLGGQGLLVSVLVFSSSPYVILFDGVFQELHDASDLIPSWQVSLARFQCRGREQLPAALPDSCFRPSRFPPHHIPSATRPQCPSTGSLHFFCYLHSVDTIRLLYFHHFLTKGSIGDTVWVLLATCLPCNSACSAACS